MEIQMELSAIIQQLELTPITTVDQVLQLKRGETLHQISS